MIATKNVQTDIYNVIHEAWARGDSGFELRGVLNEITTLTLKKLHDWRSPFPNEEGVFQVVDFFCGTGGTSLGFAALSRILPFFEIIGGCDIDADALASFEANFNAPGIQMDVRDLVEDDQMFARFLSQLKRRDEGKPLIVIGCAPCQGFTSHRKKNWDEKDERNTLVGVFASVALKLNPECIIMENVPELLGKKYWDHFSEARTMLEQAGYIVKQSIYNAASFGTPQERFRAVVIAHKKDFLLPEPLLEAGDYTSVRTAIGNLPLVEAGKTHPDDPFHRSAQHRKSTIDTIKAVPKDGGSRPRGVGPKCLDKVKGFSDVYGRLAWDKPAITITHYARNPASGRFVHPEQDRGLTMREAARLQGFPDGFHFCGSFDSVFKQIGEAVPPHLSCGVAANVLVELLSSPPLEEQKKASIESITQPVSSSYSSVIAGIKMKKSKA